MITSSTNLFKKSRQIVPLNVAYDTTILNAPILISEVQQTVKEIKHCKTVSIDGIPNKILKNASSVDMLYEFFSLCFEYGKIQKI